MYNGLNRYNKANTRALGGDAMAVAIMFLAVVCAVMAIGVWQFEAYLTMEQMIGIAFATGLVVSGIYGVRMAKRNEKRAQDAALEKRRNKDAETQKQIDAMQRGNSKIPEVKR